MRKIVFLLFLFIFSVSFISSEDYTIVKSDVDEFLGMAEEFKTFSAKYVTNASEVKDIGELFSKVTEVKKAMNPLNSFLKKKKWTFEKFSSFIYKVSIAIIAIDYYEEYGEVEEGDEDNLNFAEELSKDELELVKANKAELGKYFAQTEMNLDDGGDDDTDTDSDGDNSEQ